MLTTEECPEMNIGTGKFSDDVEITVEYLPVSLACNNTCEGILSALETRNMFSRNVIQNRIFIIKPGGDMYARLCVESYSWCVHTVT